MVRLQLSRLNFTSFYISNAYFRNILLYKIELNVDFYFYDTNI